MLADEVLPQILKEDTSQASPKFRLDVQGLRALAVLLVFAFHLGLHVPGGFIGVDIFFAISGFVITGMLEREWLNTGRINIQRFFVRRFWRLTPALATVVSATLICGACIFSVFGPQTNLVTTGIGAMLLSANAAIAQSTGGYFDLAAETNPLLNMWSLSVEEQFYLGFLLILIAGWSLGKVLNRKRFGVSALVGVVFFGSIALAMLAQPGYALDNPNWLFHFYSPLNRAWEFAAGALVALASTRLISLPSRLKSVFAATGIILIGYSAFAISGAQVWPGWMTILPVTATTLVIIGNAENTTVISRALASNAATFIGDRSYSLYLWHWPVIVIVKYFHLSRWLEISWIVAMTVVLTIATYLWIEMPLRKRSFGSGTKKVLWALVVFLVPIILGVTINKAITHNYWNSNISTQRLAIEAKYAVDTRECKAMVSYLHRSAKNCSWNLDAHGSPIYLVGDSNAAHFSDGLISAAKETNHPLITAITYGCPVLTSSYAQPERNEPGEHGYRKCSQFAQETRTWLKRQPRGLVIISNTDSYVTIPRLHVVADSELLSPNKNQYFELLQTTLRQLTADGFKVAVIAGPPHFDIRAPSFPKQYDWDPVACTLWSEALNTCKSAIPLPEAHKYQSGNLAGLRTATASAGATLMNLSRVFCTNKECPTQSSNLQIYRDGRHITVDASLSLMPRFVTEIRRVFSAD
jgi:peptidoglycan/LPS O-acetylase OafA/YrhL